MRSVRDRHGSTHGRFALVAFVAVLLAVPLAFVALQACGTVAESNGGDSNLPSRQIIPWQPFVDDDVLVPLLTSGDDRTISDPDAVELFDGVALFVTTRRDERSVISRAYSTDGLTFAPDVPVDVLEPDQVWEGRSVESPTAVVVDGELWVWYLGGRRGGQFDGVIGLARSRDGGLTFEKEPPPVLFPGVGEELRSPSVVATSDGFAMFVAVNPTDTDEDPPPTTIVRFNSDDGVIWERAGRVLGPGTGCRTQGTSSEGTGDGTGRETPCWDADFVRAPGVRASRSPTGRLLIDIWYTGGIGSNVGIGFAGSFEGRRFSRYRLNPVVDLGRAHSASVVDLDGQLFMYFADETEDDVPAIFAALQGPDEDEDAENEDEPDAGTDVDP